MWCNFDCLSFAPYTARQCVYLTEEMAQKRKKISGANLTEILIFVNEYYLFLRSRAMTPKKYQILNISNACLSLQQ